ncbi:multidrug transporter [Elizabethkingia anophelis]|nr:hypothetical protein [Elizabethkingia anophelis]EQB92774.1 hypothetical protein C874_17825 [Elizabethkingia anophelis 502]KGT09153.1 multidrug transporter [Elizabethkingia anophelis]MCL1688345.1 hypothetical protein [Elizabethkingia anophelis]MDV3566521.1 multidrug transporter [Elizabethkingia anophelis]MDV3970772.1 multidrug transporter [Elizabethkingia anophelis]
MSKKKYRDAKTGRYVTEEYAKEHKGTTVGETDKSNSDKSKSDKSRKK